MENNDFAKESKEVFNKLEPTSDLEKIQNIVGNDPADLSEGIQQTASNADNFNNKSPDNIVTDKVYKDILEEEANAVVGSE